MFRKLLKRMASRLGYAVIQVRNRYEQDGLFSVHSQAWRATPEFKAAYARGVQAAHGADPGVEWRTHIALWAARVALSARGDFFECGVNAGFLSSAIMHRLNWSELARRFYLIDTFSGPVLEQYSPQEVASGRLRIAQTGLDRGAYVTDIDGIRANFSEWPSAIVVPGAVPEILHSLDPGEVAFVHIDMNCAAPDVAAFEFFWDRLSPGGIVLFDDYGYYGHDSQREAIDAAVRLAGIEILALPTGQGLVVKPPQSQIPSPQSRTKC
ncbi:MAG TPA: class I SAM-dependent methyltransferase [Bryobacteraceae bacterium]|nr:class I SAM-dependent methyltransferase [Bryobacteraceae bacterium]